MRLNFQFLIVISEVQVSAHLGCKSRSDFIVGIERDVQYYRALDKMASLEGAAYCFLLSPPEMAAAKSSMIYYSAVVHKASVVDASCSIRVLGVVQ